MNISDLKSVLAIARYGSINKAAKELFIAQPNLSKSIQNLEKEYGIQIFERSSRGVWLTMEGQVFVAQAQKIIREIDRLDKGFQREERQEISLKVSIPRASYASYAFVEYVKNIDYTKNIRIHFRECDSLEAIDNILTHDYNLALIRYGAEQEEQYQSLLKIKKLHYDTVLEFQYLLLMSKDSPLADRKVVVHSDLQGCIELIHGDTRLPNGDYVNLMDDCGSKTSSRRIHIFERGIQMELLREIPEAYMWGSPLPEDVLRQNGLVQKKCDCSKKMKDVLVCSDDSPGSEELAFIRHLKMESGKLDF